MGGGRAGWGGGGGGQAEGVDKACLDAGDGKFLIGLLLPGAEFLVLWEDLLLILFPHLPERDWITMREENVGMLWDGI